MKLEMALDDLAIQTGGLLLGTGKESQRFQRRPQLGDDAALFITFSSRASATNSSKISCNR